MTSLAHRVKLLLHKAAGEEDDPAQAWEREKFCSGCSRPDVGHPQPLSGRQKRGWEEGAELWARPFGASVFPLTPKQLNPNKSRLAEKSPCKAARHTSLLA